MTARTKLRIIRDYIYAGGRNTIKARLMRERILREVGRETIEGWAWAYHCRGFYGLGKV